MRCRQIIISRHAVQRMFERGISFQEVETTLQTGAVIEDYPDDSPYPSRLLLGGLPSKPLHVVSAWNEEEKTCIVVTVYRPSPYQWHWDYKTRKP